MASIRQRLESTRRRQNVSVALLQLGRWLLACSLLFAALAAVCSFFDLSKTAWQGVFGLWVGSVFVISSFLIWRFLAQWQDGRHFVHRVEQELPQLEQRLITSVELEGREAPGVSRQFIDKLYQDARARVEERPLASAVSFRPAWRALGLAGLSLASLVFLLLVSEPFLQASRQIAWPWASDRNPGAAAGPAIVLRVEPGDVAMQRGDDMVVTAALDNASSDRLTLYLQDDHVNWTRVSMAPEQGQPQGNAKVFSADLRQLSQDLVYYVEYRGAGEADAIRSPQYRVRLFDLPRVDEVEVAYDFPDYTGLEDRVDKPGGDVVAPVGTTIKVSARLNKAVATARLVFDNGTSLPLQVEHEQASGSFQVREDSGYRIELTDSNDFRNKDPLDYYIRAIPDREPEVTLQAPGKDRRVMPLEEVAIEVDARDDYGLSGFQLTYSVVGAGEQQVDFQPANRRSVNGRTLVYLEDLQVKPGDIVSYSITARDNNALSGPSEVVSDIYFLEVIPTDHEFSRARSGGGGGGGAGGGDASALVRNQKDVIAATWKLRNRQGKADDESFAEDGQIIRDSQAEVAQRAQMSINRLTERGNFADDNYQNAVVALRRAIAEMQDAVTRLDQLALTTALQSEQRALQAILQAESQVNKTEVALNRSNGGNGGVQRREREDLRELFDMEMGELENRYELPQQRAGQPQQAQNETLDKLKELARRQEKLTRSQRELARHENQMDEEQKRRQLEKLRREQEELQQQLADLSRSMRRQQGQSQPSSGGGRGDRQQRESQQREQRLEELQQALEQMQQAAQSDSPSQAAAKGQKALDSLRRQAEAMNAGNQKSLAALQESVKERSRQLLQDQRDLRRQVQEKSREASLGDTRSETTRSGRTDGLLQKQSDIREGLNQLGRELRDIATRAGDDQQREMQEAHDIARQLRPIQEKMNTSKQILQRGMLNLSLKIEGDIETALADLEQRIQSMGDGPGARGGDRQGEAVAQQVRQLKDSLQKLQQQVQEQAGNGSRPAEQPEDLAVRRGERSGAGRQQVREADLPSQRRAMEESLQRSRELAQGLAQLGLGGEVWSGTARSIRSQLSRQGLEEFLSRPELLQDLLAPVIELEKQLRVQAELNEIDNKLYSALEEDIPEEYKSLVESYYRVLSESKTSSGKSP